MDDKRLESYRTRLLELRRRLVREVDSTVDALRQDVIAPGDISTLPTHPADQDAEGVDAEIAIAQNEERLLEEVGAALARIEEFTFGVCVECGREISAERLNAIPYAARCIDCARRHREEQEPPMRGQPRRPR
jgi:RNA polymerase-binding protein DksA